MKSNIKKIELHTEPLGIMPDGSLALSQIVDVYIQQASEAEEITITTTIKNKES